MSEHRIAKTMEICVGALDAAIALGPDAPHQDIADAVRCVIDLRNHVIALKREGKLNQAQVDQANSLVSLAYGAEHPLIGFHLHRLEQTRDGARKLGRALKPRRKG